MDVVMGKKRLFKCSVCGHIVEDAIPDKCEVCGADGDAFVEIFEMEAPAPIDTQKTYLILGNGTSGFNAAKEIRRLSKEARIIMVSREKVKSYIRTNLGDYLGGTEPVDRFFLAKDDWYAENKIELHLGKVASQILPQEKKVRLSDGSELGYDKLILATGGFNFIPPVQVEFGDGSKRAGFALNAENLRDVQGLHTIREYEDTRLVAEEVKHSKKAVVIGGGLLGLEAAWELRLLGLDVTVVEFVTRLLPRQLDSEGASIFSSIANKSGLNLILGDSAQYIKVKYDESIDQPSKAKVVGVALKSGGFVEADLVVFSIGIRSNIAIAKAAGIACDKGIIVNRKMETSQPDIYACGDACEIDGFVYGTWPAAMAMGKIAGTNSAGSSEEFKKLIMSTIFNSLNAKVFSAGAIDFDDATLEQVSSRNDFEGTYRKAFFKGGRMVAGVLIGDTSKSIKLLKSIENGIDYEAAKENGLV